MNKKCLGCGVMMQKEHYILPGFIEPEKYDLVNYCRRCFRIKNYGDYTYIDKKTDEFESIMRTINATNDLVLYVVDLFNLDKNIAAISIFLNNPMILVLSKRDVLPKSVSDAKLHKWIEQYNLNIVDSIIVSSMKNYNIDDLFKKINKHKKSNSVYVVGNTNAGKSTLINKMVKNYSTSTQELTTSMLKTTTLDFVETKINDSLTLVDTPGLLGISSIQDGLPFHKIKKINPRLEVKPRTFQLRDAEAVIVDELLRVENFSHEKNSLTFYVSNEIEVDRINLQNNIRLNKLVMETFEILGEEDIVISGLGWIKITSFSQINVFHPANVDVFVRKSII